MSTSTITRAHHARRLTDAPVVQAGSVPNYGAIFNAGLTFHDGRYHLFARGVRSGYRRNDVDHGPRFVDYISDILVFESHDGHDYSFAYVLAESSADTVYCFEDPRVQRISSNGEEHWVMTYTALPDPASGEPWRIGVHTLDYRDGRFHLVDRSRRVIGPHGLADKDGVVFNLLDGRVVLVHRLEQTMQLAVFDSLEHLLDADQSYWESHVETLHDHIIIAASPSAAGVGAGAPPVVTEDGLLVFYHERQSDHTYTMNVALLDSHTGRVKAMLAEPIMVPELEWELEGDVDRVVFVQGAHRRDDGTIYLVYGAADRHIGAAVVDESALLTELRAATQLVA